MPTTNAVHTLHLNNNLFHVGWLTELLIWVDEMTLALGLLWINWQLHSQSAVDQISKAQKFGSRASIIVYS